jgi:hypothetical protein
MHKPTLTELPSSRDVIDVFGGYNHNMRIGNGEFYDMQNLTSAYYPLLAPRKQRGTYYTPTDKPTCLIEKDALCYVFKRGTNLFFRMNQSEYDLGMTPIEEDVERSLVSMGAYVVVFPDKLYINTKDTTDKGNIDAEFTTSGTVKFELCDMDGNPYVVNEASADEPSSPTDKMIWLDQSTTPASLKQYSATSGMWMGIATVYVKISATNLGAAFEQYDGVKISGVSADISSDLNTTAVVWAKDENSITVVGILNQNLLSQDTAITVSRKMPEMDFVIESNNRLWGCRYGLQGNDVVNELYACKQGDFKNWNCYMGIATDSYAVSLGTDGQFTGAISYLGRPTFFKENCCHVVYGNYPAQYQVQDTALRGVQKGSEKSLAMVNEVLYYKSRTGVCAYNGALPTEISAALGEKSYSNAVGCAYKNKYYISMFDKSENVDSFFVYDVEKGMWHKEDNLKAECFCPVDDEIYYISEGSIRTLFGSGTKDTEKIKWMAETGDLGVDAPDKKYISRLSVRLSMDIGTRVYISIKYDSSSGWERICSLTGNNLRSFTLPIKPKRCDHLKLKFEGIGDAKIYSISKTVEIGSDV